MVTCGWYGNVQVDVERAAAYGGGELLALGDALDQGHEDDRARPGRNVPVPRRCTPKRS